MDKKKDAWFVQVVPGAWLLPANWKGFLFMLIGIAAGIALILYSKKLGDDGNKTEAWIAGGAAIAWLLLFLKISFQKSRKR